MLHTLMTVIFIIFFSFGMQFFRMKSVLYNYEQAVMRTER